MARAEAHVRAGVQPDGRGLQTVSQSARGNFQRGRTTGPRLSRGISQGIAIPTFTFDLVLGTGTTVDTEFDDEVLLLSVGEASNNVRILGVDDPSMTVESRLYCGLLRSKWE